MNNVRVRVSRTGHLRTPKRSFRRRRRKAAIEYKSYFFYIGLSINDVTILGGDDSLYAVVVDSGCDKEERNQKYQGD